MTPSLVVSAVIWLSADSMEPVLWDDPLTGGVPGALQGFWLLAQYF